MDAIHWAFKQTYDISQREPLLIFDIPNLGRFHCYGIAYQFWLQMALAQCVTSLMNTIAAVFIYHLVVRQRGNTAAYLVGWGVIIPLSWYFPYYLLPYLRVENAAIVFGFLGFPAYVPFRCLEAMYGTTPAFCEASLRSYISYLASPIPLAFDSKTGRPIPTTAQELKLKSKKALSTFIVTIIIFNILEPTNYTPFPHRRPAEALKDYIHWGSLLNNYVAAYIASVMLETGSLVFQIAIGIVSGYSCIPFNDSPLFSSTSPSDFWGRRWNQQVQSTLKRGVYKPLRMNFSPLIATFGTFFASGILHEYTLSIAAVATQKDDYSYKHRFGLQLLFFLWNFAVILLEYLLRDNKTIHYWSVALPKPVITTIVLLTVLPISHWFTDEWVLGGFFTGVSLGFPRQLVAPITALRGLRTSRVSIEPMATSTEAVKK